MYIIFIHISEKTLEIQVDKQVCNSAIQQAYPI